MATTLKDVAARAGVHPSTVSRVLRGKEILHISPKTRKKILKAAKELDYQPDQTARALRLKKSNSIGMIIPNISSPFFSGIAKTVDNECTKAGYTLIICDTNENQEKEKRAVSDLRSRGVDGIILAPVQEQDDHICDMMNKNFPLVLIDRHYSDIKTNAVICNDEDSAYLAVSHLAQLGHKRVGFICGRANLYPVKRRLSGYKRGILEHQLNNDDKLISSGGPLFESGYESAIHLLSLSPLPTAFLISGTVITIGVIKALIEKKFTIPQDISIISFTDTIFAPYLRQPITTISHRVQEIGKNAWELLFKHLNSKAEVPYSTIIVKNRVENRGSTAALTKEKKSIENQLKFN